MTGRTEHHRRRSSVRGVLLAAAGLLYLVGMGGATWLAFAAAPPVHRVVTSAEFRNALQDAQHPITEADLPRLLPGIPIYPGARLDPIFRSQIMASVRAGETRVHLVAPASPEQILTFYRRRLSGWRVEYESLEPDRESLRVARGGRAVSIGIMPEMPRVLQRGKLRGFAISVHREARQRDGGS